MQKEFTLDLETRVDKGKYDFPKVTPGASDLLNLGRAFCGLSEGGSHCVGRQNQSRLVPAADLETLSNLRNFCGWK